MADEKVKPSVSLMEAQSTEKKTRKSKKWKKKLSRDETSKLLQSSTENGHENADLNETEHFKPNTKERKSFKDRIRKISIRKSSKGDKRNFSSLADKTEEEVIQKDLEVNKFANKPEVDEDSHGDDGTKADEEINESYVNDELRHIVRGEEPLKNEEENNLEVISEYKAEDVVGHAQVGEESETFLQSSRDTNKLEEEEIRKSKEKFDTVIEELESKEVKIEEKEEDKGAIHGDEVKVHKETASEDVLERETDCSINEDGQLENKEHQKNTSEVLHDESSSKVLMRQNSEVQERKDDEISNKTESMNEDLDQEVKRNLDNGLESKLNNENKKIPRYINDENLDLSQSITKKTVGKVTGRYRQVQLTKTYCQCCSLM